MPNPTHPTDQRPRKKSIQEIEKPSAEEVLVKLIKEVEVALPHIKDKLQEAFPQSFDGNTLEIIIDAGANRSDLQMLEKERPAIENCLKRIIPGKNTKLAIIKKDEVLSPHETLHLHSRDIGTLKEKAEKNEFVKEILKRFDGKIIDVWGT